MSEMGGAPAGPGTDPSRDPEGAEMTELGNSEAFAAERERLEGEVATFKDKFLRAFAEAENVRFGQLIDKARTERLSTIDTQAAAEQERVEMIEREYMERLERERQAELPGEAALPAPAKPADQPE
jgi:hypothetical protein